MAVRSERWRVGRAVLAGACAVLGTVAWGPRAGAIDNGEWGVAPAETVDHTPRTSFAYDSWPNHTIGDSLVVSNLTDRAARFRVYAADGAFDSTGSEVIEGETDPVDGVGGWITLSPKLQDGTIEVPARSESIIPFEVAVPVGTPVGSYLGGLAAIRLDEVRSGDAIRIEQAVATVVRVEVAAGAPAPRLEVRDLAVDPVWAWWPGGGSSDVTLEVENVGRLPATFAVVGSSDAGAVSSATGLTLDPKESRVVRLRVGGAAVVGSTHVAITVRADGGAPTKLAGSAVTVPVWVVIIAVAVGVLVRRARRRRMGGPSGRGRGDGRDDGHSEGRRAAGELSRV